MFPANRPKTVIPFAIERYFAKYEFTARYLLSSSDCESFSLAEVLEMADAETKRLWDQLGGSICFPRSLISQNTFEFCEQLVQETGIMLLPSRMFMFGDNHVRVGYGRENLPDVVNRFADYLNRRFR